MSTVDVDAIRDKWLRVCGACGAGLSTGCVCPQEDPRPVMLGLVREVERLRARIAAHAGPHRRVIADRDEARAEVGRLRADLALLFAVYEAWMNADTYDPGDMRGITSLLGTQGAAAIEEATDAVDPHASRIREMLSRRATGEDGTRDG